MQPQRPGRPENAPNPHDADESWLAQLAFLRRRWLVAAAVFAGFMAVAVGLSTRLPPVYQATTRLLMGPAVPHSALLERGTPFEGYFLERRSFETQLEVLRSEPVATRAAERLGRIDASTPPALRRAAVDAVKAAIRVEPVQDTRIVLLRARDPWPEGARDLSNAVAEAYIDYAEEQRSEARRASIAWLSAETTKLREELRSSEERLVQYLSEVDIELLSEVEARGGAEAEGEALRAEISAAELALAQLLRRYRERHPRVVEARSRLASLKRRAEGAAEQRAEDHLHLIQYRILKRDADLDHEMYQVLLKKLKEADLSTGVAEPPVRVLEAARRPRAPIAPHTVRNLGVACVLALCLALSVAWAIETFDRTLKSADDSLRALGLPTLAVVARFAAAQGAGASGGLAAEAIGSAEAETFRALRTNVRFSHVDKPRRVVLVTSNGPEEGKSTVVANLAVSFAQSGRRTLLIDTDLRRPSLHRLFRLSNASGLADLLAGDAELETVVQTTQVEGLEVLTSGTRPPNPAELIESARLSELTAELRGRYDFVLLDSPPAGGLIDASLLCALADGVLFVVERGRFERGVLRSALQQLERAGAKVYGVVLNKSPRERAGLYGYYGYGAELADGDASPARAG